MKYETEKEYITRALQATGLHLDPIDIEVIHNPMNIMLQAADAVIARGPLTVDKVVVALRRRNPGIRIQYSTGGFVDRCSLAAAIKVDCDRRRKELEMPPYVRENTSFNNPCK